MLVFNFLEVKIIRTNFQVFKRNMGRLKFMGLIPKVSIILKDNFVVSFNFTNDKLLKNYKESSLISDEKGEHPKRSLLLFKNENKLSNVDNINLNCF